MDIVDRLRNGCTCNFESTPCGAEEECQNAFDGADEIVKLREILSTVLEACEDVNSPDRKVREEITRTVRKALKEKE
ncbi:hypothetical protein UFOVP1459_45 [uncultured Caudovirales phage]|uniref:Uncharacterized protein n=1 Tax=uncultured Caudovirales phage TaxID=2100421 RepID=A0A6J5SL41_9CAUD|nr:hypothetical protein UFOVP1459_45 [uncultured Caudovirales phage]CAB4218423.1 hypothetical protein UFOVP1609_19 [uncultured Caudovirales phage]